MSQQHPQQPGWGQPPQQPGWGTPPPQPPKKTSPGKVIGIIAAAVAAVIVIGTIASNSSTDPSSDTASTDNAKPSPTATKDDKPGTAAEPTKAATKPAEEAKPKIVTFKVWGTAPAGALGPLDINYGSDSDSRAGTFKNGTFTATLPLDDDAMFYNVMAQLQGSGDIQCSVTIDGKTKKGHASGDYNICDAQMNADFLGGWS